VLASTPTHASDKESSESDSVDDSALVMVTVMVFDVEVTADLGTWTPVAVDSTRPFAVATMITTAAQPPHNNAVSTRRFAQSPPLCLNPEPHFAWIVRSELEADR
jgi:hypothetical protein